MDDSKVHGNNLKQVDILVQTVRVLSNDVCMGFCILKCAMLVMKKGKLQTLKVFICLMIEKLKQWTKLTSDPCILVCFRRTV